MVLALNTLLVRQSVLMLYFLIANLVLFPRVSTTLLLPILWISYRLRAPNLYVFSVYARRRARFVPTPLFTDAGFRPRKPRQLGPFPTKAPSLCEAR